MKKILALLLSLTLIACMILLTSCDDKEDDKENSDGNDKNEAVEYSVTVVDYDGNALSGVIVTAFQDGAKKGMKSTDSNGKVIFDFDNGTYTFTLTFVGKEQFAYDTAICVLTEAASSITVKASSKADETVELYNGGKAGIVKEAAKAYYAEFSKDEPAYFLFTPTVAGRYKVSISSDVSAKCSYNGSPMIIYENDISNESDRNDDGSIFMDFRSYNLNQTQYLFSVSSETEGFGFFKIEKVAELERIPEEYEWTVYQPTNPTQITKFTYTGGALTAFDVTNVTLKAVYNEADGYYHLNSVNGPILYVNLNKENPYVSPIAKISETEHFGYYVYDDNGMFDYKISYVDTLLKYIENADENTGVYPMTYDLALIIKEVGTKKGWFTADNGSISNLFFDGVQITVNSWLFACCYDSGL